MRASTTHEPGAEILQASGHGLVSANDEASITAVAGAILERERRGERPRPIDRFSWEATLERVAAFIDGGFVAGGRGRPSGRAEPAPVPTGR